VKRKFRCQKGAAAIEAAVVLSLFLVPLFMGIIDASLAIYNAQVIANASREGARFGIKIRDNKYTETEIEEVINHYCFGSGGNNKRLITWGSEVSSISPNDIDVVWSNSAPAQTYEDTITVTVTFKYSPLFLGILLPELTLQETTYMKMEGLN
jgi:Flp pilus assembly protein TadG